MIETILHQIIKDLGATGVLIVGFFVVQYFTTKKICKHLRILNHKSTEINQTLQYIGAFLERELYGKMGRDAEHTS
jgi:hypothetical protein